MNFRDRWVKDESGAQFVFTVEMQRRLSQAGLPVDPAYLSQLGAAPPTPVRHERPQVMEQPRQQQSEEETAVTTIDFAEPFTIQIDPQTGKYIGRLKWYNPKKGYGFLVRGAGEEIFFHKSSTVGDPEDLSEGQWVLYDIEETRKGPEAMEIEPYTGDVEGMS
jgi:cold shock protein